MALVVRHALLPSEARDVGDIYGCRGVDSDS